MCACACVCVYVCARVHACVRGWVHNLEPLVGLALPHVAEQVPAGLADASGCAQHRLSGLHGDYIIAFTTPPLTPYLSHAARPSPRPGPDRAQHVLGEGRAPGAVRTGSIISHSSDQKEVR